MNILLRCIHWFLRPSMQFAESVIRNTPEHCGADMEFIGVHRSLFETIYTYQCSVCKSIEQVKA